jgi:hypothetical protein
MTIYIPSTNYFNESRFIVDSTAGEGRYTTIQAAITAASAGETVFIRGGTYTENITLIDGVNLAAFTDDTNQVTISGSITMSSAGTVTISGITCQTNGATAVSFSSANLQTLTFTNCTLTSTNADLVTNSNSNVSSNLRFTNCSMSAAATYKILAASNTGTLTFKSCSLSGASTTASTSTSSGVIVFFQGTTTQVFSLTGTTNLSAYGLNVGTNNLTFLTLGTGTTSFIYGGRISTGTASCFNITSTGYVYCFSSTLDSSNASTVTGTGTFYDGLNTYQSVRNPASTTVTLLNNTITNGAGTSGQILRSNGTTSLPTWATPSSLGGSLILIQTQTASASANISFTTGISSTYDNYILIVSNYVPATTLTDLRMTVSTNGGSSYLAAGYTSGNNVFLYNSATPSNVNASTYYYILNANSTSSIGSSYIYLFGGTNGFNQNILTYGNRNATTTVLGTGNIAQTAINAIRFASSSGNITSGIFSLYGVAK